MEQRSIDRTSNLRYCTFFPPLFKTSPSTALSNLQRLVLETTGRSSETAIPPLAAAVAAACGGRRLEEDSEEL